MSTEKQYFDNHENVSKLYFTSDQLAFFDEQNALNHAKHLDDKTITTRTRDEVDAELEAITSDKWQSVMEYDQADELDAE